MGKKSYFIIIFHTTLYNSYLRLSINSFPPPCLILQGTFIPMPSPLFTEACMSLKPDTGVTNPPV